MKYSIVLDDFFNKILKDENEIVVQEIKTSNISKFENYKLINTELSECLKKDSENEKYFLKDNSFNFKQECFSVGFTTNKASLMDKNLFVAINVTVKKEDKKIKALLDHYNYYNERQSITHTHSSSTYFNSYQELTEHIFKQAKETFKSLERLFSIETK